MTALSTVTAEVAIINHRGMVERSTKGFLWNAIGIHNEALLQHYLNRGVASVPATMQSTKSSFSTLFLASVLALVFLGPSIPPVSAASYTPSIASGQLDEYNFIARTCQSYGTPE